MFVMRLAALVTGSISFLLIVIGLAIPSWIYMVDQVVPMNGSDTNFSITANIGFWDYCLRTEFYGRLHSECGKLYESKSSDMTAVSAALLLIGMLMMAGSIVVCVTSTFSVKENKRLPILGGVCTLFAGKLYKSRVCFTKHIWEHSVYWDLFEGAKNHDRVLSIQAALILYSGYQGCVSVGEDPLKNLLVTFPNVPGERKDCPGSPDYKMKSTKTTPKKRTSPLKRKKSFED